MQREQFRGYGPHCVVVVDPWKRQYATSYSPDVVVVISIPEREEDEEGPH